MSEDQGFHEVQLSGKQLVFLFMSAVVLMVVAFLLGVNVGRGVRTAVGDTEISAQGEPVPATSQAAEDTVAKTDPAKPAQPELSYHDMLLGAAAQPDKVGGEKTPPPVAPPPVEETVPPAATPAAAATPTPGPMTAPPAMPTAAGWFLQTGAFTTQGVADGEVAKLKQLNFPAFVLPPGATAGDKMFRVRVGPYSDRRQAEQASGRLARQGIKALITR